MIVKTLFFVGFLFLYFLPTTIALINKNRHLKTIFFTNLFLGYIATYKGLIIPWAILLISILKKDK